MKYRADIALLLQRLARYRNMSDGAKVTFLEFLSHFWTEDKRIPSYTEMSAYRNVVRSTIQLHVEELERSGLLVSVRLPDNRKRYRANYEVLKSVSSASKKESIRATCKTTKHIGKYTTPELCGYFYKMLNTMTGKSQCATRVEYNNMKVLHRKYGASAIIKAMERFSRIHQRKKLPFRLDVFLMRIPELIETESAAL